MISGYMANDVPTDGTKKPKFTKQFDELNARYNARVLEDEKRKEAYVRDILAAVVTTGDIQTAINAMERVWTLVEHITSRSDNTLTEKEALDRIVGFFVDVVAESVGV